MVLMKKLFILGCILLGSINMFAQHRNEQEAIRIAQDFFKPVVKKSRLVVVPQQKVQAKLAKVSGSNRAAVTKNSSCFIINDEVNNRFVIVSADERFYKILGYSNNGIFDPENAPIGLLELLDGYDAQYEYLLEHAPTAPLLDVRKDNFPIVEPLIKSKWNQNAPYWNLCPYDYSQTSSHPCYTGCVATALAQVMYYYKYPDDAQGYYSYTTSFGSTLTVDYDTVHFNWDKMCDTYVYYYDDNGERLRVPERTAEENEEVAKLMKACGVSVAMKYGTGGSYAYSQDLVASLVKYFKYNPNILYKRKDDFSTEDWDQMILKDLQEGHPILYSGSEGGWTGHQFILDGCDENGLYHFNFGWSGNDDGYYSLTGTDAIDYKYGQAMVYQITPEKYGIHEDYNVSRFEMHKINVALGDDCQFSLQTDYARSGVKTDALPFNGLIGVGLFDTEYNFIDSLYSKQITAGTTYESIWRETLFFDGSKFLDGKDYIIAPFSKAVEAQQPDLILNKNGNITYYTAKRVNNTIHLSPQGVEILNVSGVYKVVATNQNGQQTGWYARIDLNEKTSDYNFTIYNIDPAASNMEDSRMCRISGELSHDGTQLKLSKYVCYGSDVVLMNYSNIKDDIILYINLDNGQLTINDTWGAVLRSDSSVVSQYMNTLFTPISRDELELTIASNYAGELTNKIPPSIKNFITSLTLTGTINGTDIKFIRELATTGSLMHLDISEARIVEGGESYYEDYQTQNNVIGKYMFYYCGNLKSITLPSNIISIGEYAFYNCDGIESIILPEGINEIPSSAFSLCDNLSYLSIPSSVRIIANCISYCRSIKRIDCYIRNVESLKSSSYSWATAGDIRAFKDVPDGCEWHVPHGLTQQYTSQSWWNPTWTINDDLNLNLLMGDSNDDGEIDVADVMSIAHYIMLQPLPTFMFDTSDMDHDGMVDVADLMQVIQLIMQQSSASSTRKSARGVNCLSQLLLNPSKEYSVLSISSKNDYVAAQFDVCLPQGTYIRTICSKNHDASIHFERLDNRTYRVVMFSVDGRPLAGMDNELLTLTFTDESIVPDISNVLFVSNCDEKHYLEVDNGHTTKVNVPEIGQSVRAYTIDGRKVITGSPNKLTKGFYIINGKKNIVK